MPTVPFRIEAHQGADDRRTARLCDSASNKLREGDVWQLDHRYHSGTIRNHSSMHCPSPNVSHGKRVSELSQEHFGRH